MLSRRRPFQGPGQALWVTPLSATGILSTDPSSLLFQFPLAGAKVRVFSIWSRWEWSDSRSSMGTPLTEMVIFSGTSTSYVDEWNLSCSFWITRCDSMSSTTTELAVLLPALPRIRSRISSAVLSLGRIIIFVVWATPGNPAGQVNVLALGLRLFRGCSAVHAAGACKL